MKRKTNIRIRGCFALICAAVLPVLSGCSDIIPPVPDVPVVTYAEFPFTLVYELDGNEITINDKIICEYTGNAWVVITERYRDWGMRFESGEELILKTIGENDYIVFYPGATAAYWMGDTENPKYNDGLIQGYRLRYHDSGGRTESYVTRQELYEVYGIRFISFDYAPPIENSFIPAE